MARYFFHVYDDFEHLDPVGRELGDADAVMKLAIEKARHVAGYEVHGIGTLSLSHRIEVMDANGELVAKVRFADAVRVRT